MTGKGIENPKKDDQKTFDDYLMEAFRGEVVQRGDKISNKVSTLTRENLIRLSNY